MTPQSRPWPPNWRSRSMPPSTVSPSSTITATMGDLPTMHSSNHAKATASGLPSVASTLICKMGSRSVRFTPSPAAHASNYSMLAPNGQPLSISLCAICPQKRRPPPQQPASAGGWHIKAGAIQLNSSGRQHEAHAHFLGAQCLHFKMHLHQAALSLDGHHVPG
jgi:hypothetical protein